MLQAHRFPDIPVREAVAQIQARQKVRHKLPSWHAQENLIYPPSLSVEQSSSEETALYKAGLLARGAAMADLTGGMGVDTFFLSKNFKEAFYVEQQEALCQAASHNFSILGADQIKVINAAAEEFVKGAPHLDAIYLDPARRGNENQKLYKLADCQPDITSLLPSLLQLTDTILLKAAPMLDISQGLSELQWVKEVHIVAVKNEVKELLFLLQKGFSGSPLIKAVNLNSQTKTEETFAFTQEEEQMAPVSFSEPLQYLYEPNAAIMKAGAFKLVAQRSNLLKLHRNSHLYTSLQPVSTFPGRSFSILYKGKPEKKMIQQFFPDKKALISSRNHPMSVQQLSKKLGLKEGGNRYLFATTFADEKPGVVVCERIKEV